MSLYRGIEAGHIFLLGTHYSAKMGATFLDDKGENRPLVMGCYGIGVSRLVATAVEQHHDENGICWPMSIAPYQVHVVQVGTEPEVIAAVQQLEQELESSGVDVLIDDREERPGVKFKDADLIGIPLRLTVGKKALAQGAVEVKARKDGPKQSELIALASCSAVVRERIQLALQSESNRC
jgi:prolyl-tRNA synthetase